MPPLILKPPRADGGSQQRPAARAGAGLFRKEMGDCRDLPDMGLTLEVGGRAEGCSRRAAFATVRSPRAW